MPLRGGGVGSGVPAGCLPGALSRHPPSPLTPSLCRGHLFLPGSALCWPIFCMTQCAVPCCRVIFPLVTTVTLL